MSALEARNKFKKTHFPGLSALDKDKNRMFLTSVKNKLRLRGVTTLARSAPKFCVEPRRQCAKRLDGDPIGDKKVGFGVAWSSGPGQHTLGLAGLLVVPCLGLVWPGPVLPALPATTTAAAQPPPAAEGGRLLLLDQAKARQARQAQAGPSQGKAQQASQPGPWAHPGRAQAPRVC